MVVIHHTVPSEVDPPSPTHCYKPLSNETSPKSHNYRALSPKSNHDTPKLPPKKPVPILPAPEPVLLHAAPVVTTQQVVTAPQVVLPCYAAQPIVYVVQVPGAGPTPPASECSSDVENVQLCTVESMAHPMEVEQKDDIIILPLSPDHGVEHTVITGNSVEKVEAVVTSSNLSLPDRRKKRNRREKGFNINNNNNNNNNSSEEIDIDVEVIQVTPVAKTVSIVIVLLINSDKFMQGVQCKSYLTKFF